MTTRSLSRRDFLTLSAAGLAAAKLGALPALAAAAKKKIPLGLQLYSVREQCGKDLPMVLEAVAKMGYKGVEFAGYYGRDAKTLRKLLDDNGLVCCGTHAGYNTLSANNLPATVEFNQILGNKYLICPGMSAPDKAGWLAKAKEFNEIADKIKANKMVTGYHAHGGDFKKYDGETAWDIFFGNTKKEVVMQLDTGNCRDGGADPVAILKQYRGRGQTIHLKESGGPKDAVIGGGTIPWKEVFALCEADVTAWYIVEHERGTATAMDDVKRCFEALKGMGKA
jgi:sugar phosphate isomerase/epimerase